MLLLIRAWRVRYTSGPFMSIKVNRLVSPYLALTSFNGALKEGPSFFASSSRP